MGRVNILFYYILSTCVLLAHANAQSVQQAAVVPATLFSSHEVIELDLYFDLDAVLNDRGQEVDQYDALLIHKVEGEIEENHNIQIRVRGNFRKKSENCKFPPLRLNFKKKQAKGTFFHGQDKIKLVTQCQLEKYVLKEYLIYRTYNLLEDRSFRVRLARINYFDTRKMKLAFTHYGFLIEEEDQLAKRLGAKITTKFYTPTMLDEQIVLRMSIFQYLIGNSDWYVTSKHNTVLMQTDTLKPPFPVPFDFDFSDLVDGFYTRPEGVPTSMLKSRRVFKGNCLEDSIVLKEFEFFLDKKELIYSLVSDFELLKKRERKKVLKYFDRLYVKLENDPKDILRIFAETCYKDPTFK